MPGEKPHMLVSVMDSDRAEESCRERDRHAALLSNCALILPKTVDVRIISSPSALEWSVFRHSTAPYTPAFDHAPKRTLLSVSEAGKGIAPLQMAAALAGYALRLATFVPVDVICWPYAQLVTDIEQLRAAMDSFSGGKDAPVLQFVRMTVRGDGTLTSTGLSYFCGQEIRLRAIGDVPVAGLVRRACRIAAEAMLNGPFEEQTESAGLAAGERVRILPEPMGHSGRKPQWLSVECDVRSAVLSEMDT
jgi:hypothetical protein